MSATRKKGPGRFSENFPAIVQSLPVSDWPASDQAAWREACRAGGLLDEPGVVSHLAASTRKRREQRWGNFLAFLRTRGELDSSELPGARLTHERLTAYIASLTGRLRAGTVAVRVADLGYVASAIAPHENWSWIRRHPGRPSAAQVRASRKLITPPDPFRLMQGALSRCDAIAASLPSIPGAVEFRDFLIVAFATWSTLRRRKLAELRLGKHLVFGEGVIRLVFDGDSVKNGSIVDTTVPQFLHRYLNHYLQTYRPMLLGDADSDFLWINRHGEPLDYAALRSLFARAGCRLLGMPIGVHSVRHAYATTVLTADPRDTEVVAAGLAHRTMITANTHYDQSGTAGVSRTWTKLLRTKTRL